MKKVLVTGANGQLGQCLQKIAPLYKDLDFLFQSSKDLDITNDVAVELLFEKEQFNYCINCAAYTNVEQAEKTPEIAFKVNAEGVRTLALFSKKYNVSLIHISTDYVFDGEKKEPYTIDDIPNPINEYGKSKLLGEKYIQEIMENYAIIRTSWLYSEIGKNFYTTILKKAKAGENLAVTSNQTGCPTNANNLARYILELIVQNKKIVGIFHFTDGKSMTWYDFASKILLENNLQKQVKLVDRSNYLNFAQRPTCSILK
ncbi:dTDP-4-dehydrorhamnose reductase [Maribacter ulvicola]|uniref:dTDP-4-dehydrorhamnose reductase n=1 Tax=Maribacter ulvicola TaxID=228959 RepID=A0A1N6PIZ2_9FLAO|nr:dTDP-4-dehydrorhamnose reductase [Maribacter ulvicola]SIQ04233.1 dTDP-4-dehydrorhamnose reductase [Maribacter ulvicola]